MKYVKIEIEAETFTKGEYNHEIWVKLPNGSEMLVHHIAAHTEFPEGVKVEVFGDKKFAKNKINRIKQDIELEKLSLKTKKKYDVPVDDNDIKSYIKKVTELSWEK